MISGCVSDRLLVLSGRPARTTRIRAAISGTRRCVMTSMHLPPASADAPRHAGRRLLRLTTPTHPAARPARKSSSEATATEAGRPTAGRAHARAQSTRLVTAVSAPARQDSSVQQTTAARSPATRPATPAKISFTGAISEFVHFCASLLPHLPCFLTDLPWKMAGTGGSCRPYPVMRTARRTTVPLRSHSRTVRFYSRNGGIYT